MMIDMPKILTGVICDSMENNIVPVKEYGEEYPAYILNYAGKVGIAVPCKLNEKFFEHFSKMTLEYIENIKIQGKYTGVLCLSIANSDLRDMTVRDFASLCDDFANPGESGENRRRVTEDPELWVTSHSYLMGNRQSKDNPEDFWGELVVYNWLLKNGEVPDWSENKKTRVDFILPESSLEVKTTTVRTNDQMTVHGQFQLILEKTKELSLLLCRIEKNNHGLTLDDLVDNLVERGLDRRKLEEIFASRGYMEGSSIRKEGYIILEARKYKVDENFPRITPDMFKDGKMPNGIVRLEYTVDLANLPYDMVDVNELMD